VLILLLTGRGKVQFADFSTMRERSVRELIAGNKTLLFGLQLNLHRHIKMLKLPAMPQNI
jgi:hypothetical protein